MDDIFNSKKEIVSTPTFVKKFYFLDYFYILLKSIKSYSVEEDILKEFIILKNKNLLGESKYKKLTIDDEKLTKNQMVKFVYTFHQVLSESIDYKLVVRDNKVSEEKTLIHLTSSGEEALNEYEGKGKIAFNFFMLKKMEEKYFSFHQLLKLCYEDNTLKNGVLIFPVYSGLKLGFEKSSFTTNQHVLDYSNALRLKLEDDIKKYTKKQSVSLEKEEEILLKRLKADEAIGDDLSGSFGANKYTYNAVLSRFRKYWLNYFLKNIYHYEYSFDTFNLWVERAKQVGVLHTTEFFPDFSGRIIYPTSIIVRNTNNEDFRKVFEYDTGESLYIHYPKWDNNYEDYYLRTLVDEYYILQKARKTHFINLLDLKERVCFKLRIAGFIFDEFLEKAYSLNLQGKLNKIQISLEADKLPYETNAMYLKREPVLINGKLKNIIAINYN
ncbi:hypothetical protein [Dysgonomonas sp. GY617]|uniref:hypothetical protein n=1 Tax=Dysgonomonas sp. GY617 TaxID=2780420 RepID=UPI001883B925|nr:hypothetical protein [Dysgonomonas sp. GY617]MBF0578116.1 hypothetical protein [Dysgonomonas sp. GY617]